MTEEPQVPASQPRVAVIVSGSGTLLQALLDNAQGYTISSVLSDRADALGLERARAAGVPTAVVELKDFPDRAAWDRGLLRAVETFSPDLIVLAGFMRIIGEPLLTTYGGRIINTHPALLPAFPGAHGVRDALAHGVKVTGCSVIIVDAGTDTGPIVAQQAVDVLDDDSQESLHERIKVIERNLLVDVVEQMATTGWQVDGRRVRLGRPAG
ncbi:phosphoribosylglycinamide formyltransferase [Kineosporia sp. NBRC 101731]|uniref:phosphoribosylglycinamide formyltransferase n=1 Tax=Kineosporia sp. NBRC 101731 TaxID=3032199 RepID=UPI0024A54C09|nr:phosphoribosylglycinamide formyltransferase [Kineosporia sp. NBRC 101731]GLY27782.1 phosphoribosylglycinamide formyltransferase [Kineosporia sp. NBRC 101731]